MEFFDILPSPEMGSWLSEEFDQDFCYGAKASTYQNPVFATPPGSWALDNLNNTPDWIEQIENLNELSQLESFPDGILQDNFYFGPEDLFGGINAQKSEPEEEFVDHKFYDLSPESLAASPVFEISRTPPGSPQSQKLSTVKIKLKRVKRPKTSKYENSKKLKSDIVIPSTYVISKITNSQFEQTEVQPTAELHIHNGFPLINDELKEEKEIFPIDEHFKFESFTNSPVPVISLRDAFDTGEADDFLDELLNNTVIGDNTELKIDIEDNFIDLEDASPLSSVSSFVPSPQFDCSEAEMSPSTLETIDEVLQSPTKEMYEFLDVGMSKRSKNLETKTRMKKQPSESRYLRKKEQNKQAALRYRMKKKQEDNSLSNTVTQEEDHQEKLKMEFSKLKQEIHIMKNLLREAFVVKKLVPENYFSKFNSS